MLFFPLSIYLCCKERRVSVNSPLAGSLWQQPGHPGCLRSVCGVKLVSSCVGLWFVSPLQVLSFQSLPPPPVPHQL